MQGKYTIRFRGKTMVIENLISDHGIWTMLNATFSVIGTSLKPSNIGVIKAADFGGITTSEVWATKAWSEETSITGGIRPAWAGITITNTDVTSSSYTSITFSAATAIQGIFMACESTLGATTYIWSAIELPGGPFEILSGDVMQVKYSVECV